METLEIKKYPDKVLKQKALSITEIDGRLQLLIDKMIETMHYSNGIGLAGNQVGELKRLCVIDISKKIAGGEVLVLINPVILIREGIAEAEEGCLSIPGYMATVRRPEQVFIRALDRDGKEFELEAKGLLSRVIQHEIDHLDGYLFIDRLSPIKRELFKRRYIKSLKNK
jgi:peptide deformylase